MNKINIKDIPEKFRDVVTAIWRGKWVDAGGNVFWHFGYPLNRETILPIELMGGSLFHKLSTRCLVNPETLTQCTGRADKNGDLYFFGDVARHPNGCRIEIKRLSNGAINSRIIDTNPDWYNWYANFSNLKEAEIIGTIYD